MRSSEPRAGGASVRREGATLVFAGALLREGVAACWQQASARLDGVNHVDLRAVLRVDSAGLAMLAELTSRAGGAMTIEGAPAGLAELCAAYRLDGSLGFAT